MESVLTEEQLDLIEKNRLNSEERFQNRFDNDFGPGSQRNYDRGGYSGFNPGFGHGMMGRGFSGSRAQNNRDFGYGTGWCH